MERMNQAWRIAKRFAVLIFLVSYIGIIAIAVAFSASWFVEVTRSVMCARGPVQ